MKASSVSLLLGVSVLLLSGLTDSADSHVILEISALPVVAGNDVTLRCRSKDQVALEAFFFRDGSKLGSGPKGQFTIRNFQQSDEGLYWCYFDQTAESPRIWLSVRDDDAQVTLDIYALPVMAGSDVTLRCRSKDQVALEAFFFRDGSKLGSGPEGQFTIRNINQSDEGLYWCYFDQTEESPRRWLSVTGPTAPPPSSTSPPFLSSPSPSPPFSPPSASPPLSSPLLTVGLPVGSLVLLVLLVLVLVGVLLLRRNQTDAVRSAQRKHTAGLPLLTAAGAAVLLSGLLVSADSSLSVLRLCCHLVVFCPYCVSTGLMLSICCSRKTGNKPAVSMEMTQRVGGSDELDGDYEDITADVTTEHAF
ncbi:Fc receptor-like A isoform X4 [Micropterus salmoides]|uniref:Fc receptor-like A isoform X4 n=1 Tax=Micropterus salmoides TaxID=27706 RepID=UPI0018EC4D7B|nr:Fc receptor-like A isoform X4 [Micropterus salmoides]